MSTTDLEGAQQPGQSLELPAGWDALTDQQRRDWIKGKRRTVLERIDAEATSFLHDMAMAIGGGPPTVAEKALLLDHLHPELSRALAAGRPEPATTDTIEQEELS